MKFFDSSIDSVWHFCDRDYQASGVCSGLPQVEIGVAVPSDRAPLPAVFAGPLRHPRLVLVTTALLTLAWIPCCQGCELTPTDGRSSLPIILFGVLTATSK